MAGRGALRRTGLVLALAVVGGCSSGEDTPAPAPPAPAPAPAPVPAPAPPAPPAPRKAVDDRAPWEREKDPVRARTLKLEEEWRLDPEFTDTELRFADERPALVAVETKEVADGLPGPEQQEALGKALAHALAEFVPRFHAFLREAGLEPPSLADLGDERIRVMIFRSKEAFDSWSVRMRFPASRSPCYRHSDRMILGWAGELDDAAVRYLGTFALLHLYRHHYCQEDDDAAAARDGGPREKVNWDDRRLPCAFFWFEAGLAKYFAADGHGSGDPGQWRSAVPDEKDLPYLHFCKGLKRLWSLDDFVFSDADKIASIARTMQGGGTSDGSPYLVAVQGTFLIRYFLDGDGGRWRPAFFSMVRNEARGKSGLPYLFQAFGLVDDRGRPVKASDPRVAAFLKEVETGYLAYADSLK